MDTVEKLMARVTDKETLAIKMLLLQLRRLMPEPFVVAFVCELLGEIGTVPPEPTKTETADG